MSFYQTHLTWRLLVEFTLPAGPNGAHFAATQVAAAVRTLGLPPARLEEIMRAVSEAVQNTLRQRHRPGLDLPLKIQVFADKSAEPETMCCWGFFVIARTADRLPAPDNTLHHVIKIFLYQEGIQLRASAT